MPKAVRTLPKKPYPEFPLTPHSNGQWCKFIRGRTYYFGHWEDWQEALAIYTARHADIEAGLVASSRVTMNDHSPTRSEKGITLAELVNHFLTAKEKAVEAETLSPRSFVEYHEIGIQVTQHFGRNRQVATLGPVDFIGLKDVLSKGKKKKHISIERLGKLIILVRLIFNFGAKNGLHGPLVFGTEFVKPKAEQLRKAKAKRQREGQSKKLFTSQELRDLLEVAEGQMRGMILLALNGGLGNNDIALMPFDAVDMDEAFIDYPRPKTGVDRRIPLWPETVDAIRAAMQQRPKQARPEYKNLIFLTRWGNPWVRFDKRRENCKKENPKSPLTQEFRRLMQRQNSQRKHRGFYSLRHTFRTVADEVLDQGAIDMIMGHENFNDMRTHYVEERDRARLKRVVEHVRAWLWPRSPWPRKPADGA